MKNRETWQEFKQVIRDFRFFSKVLSEEYNRFAGATFHAVGVDGHGVSRLVQINPETVNLLTGNFFGYDVKTRRRVHVNLKKACRKRM